MNKEQEDLARVAQATESLFVAELANGQLAGVRQQIYNAAIWLGDEHTIEDQW